MNEKFAKERSPIEAKLDAKDFPVVCVSASAGGPRFSHVERGGRCVPDSVETVAHAVFNPNGGGFTTGLVDLQRVQVPDKEEALFLSIVEYAKINGPARKH